MLATAIELYNKILKSEIEWKLKPSERTYCDILEKFQVPRIYKICTYVTYKNV